MNVNKVLLKGRQGGITVVLDPESAFEELKELLREKVTGAKDFLGKSTTSISFDGKILSAAEENELLHIISQHSDVNISYFTDKHETAEGETRTAYKPHPLLEERAFLFGKEEKMGQIADIIFTEKENQTLYHHGSLRSGQMIEYRGSVVIIGDVNPGAEVIAEGHVMIMGWLRGLVHAGCTGLIDAQVIALRLEPIQLRIGSVYTYIPDDKQGRGLEPSIAYVADGKIYVRSLMDN